MFEIAFEDLALKKLRKLDRHTAEKIISYFDSEELLKNPKKFGLPLRNEKKGNWRYRIGDYRVICKIKDKELIILFLDVGHRKEIYG